MNLHQQLYMLLDGVSQRFEQPIPLIFAYQNDGRMTKPYGSIRIDTIQMPQHEYYFPVLETGYQDLGSWRRATVELQIFGINAGSTARRFAMSLASNTSLEHQHKLNVAVGNRLFLSEVPMLMNASQYEERGIYQFQLYFSDQIEDNVGLIEEVEINWVDGPTIWDKGYTDWDDDQTVWDDIHYCHINVRAFPPYTPEHPAPAEKE